MKNLFNFALIVAVKIFFNVFLLSIFLKAVA